MHFAGDCIGKWLDWRVIQEVSAEQRFVPVHRSGRLHHKGAFIIIRLCARRKPIAASRNQEITNMLRKSSVGDELHNYAAAFVLPFAGSRPILHQAKVFSPVSTLMAQSKSTFRFVLFSRLHPLHHRSVVLFYKRVPGGLIFSVRALANVRQGVVVFFTCSPPPVTPLSQILISDSCWGYLIFDSPCLQSDRVYADNSPAPLYAHTPEAIDSFHRNDFYFQFLSKKSRFY